jgi:hypothetical protein
MRIMMLTDRGKVSNMLKLFFHAQFILFFKHNFMSRKGKLFNFVSKNHNLLNSKLSRLKNVFFEKECSNYVLKNYLNNNLDLFYSFF